MDLKTFEGWVSDHYDELVAAAKRVTKRSEEAVDMLHTVVETIIDSGSLPDHIDGIVPWIGQAIRRDFYDRLRHDEMSARNLALFGKSLATLGPEDTYLDLNTEDMRRAKQRAYTARHRAKKKGAVSAPIATPLEGVEFTGQMTGNIRWRFQQLRDGRLFDERAVRSLAESMHRTSQRGRHFGEAGYSHTEFGTEGVRA